MTLPYNEVIKVLKRTDNHRDVLEEYTSSLRELLYESGVRYYKLLEYVLTNIASVNILLSATMTESNMRIREKLIELIAKIICESYENVKKYIESGNEEILNIAIRNLDKTLKKADKILR